MVRERLLGLVGLLNKLLSNIIDGRSYEGDYVDDKKHG